jgi:hypothetical protein
MTLFIAAIKKIMQPASNLSLGTNQNGQVLKALESYQWSSFCGGKALNFLSVINHFEQ